MPLRTILNVPDGISVLVGYGRVIHLGFLLYDGICSFGMTVWPAFLIFPAFWQAFEVLPSRIGPTCHLITALGFLSDSENRFILSFICLSTFLPHARLQVRHEIDIFVVNLELTSDMFAMAIDCAH